MQFLFIATIHVQGIVFCKVSCIVSLETGIIVFEHCNKREPNPSVERIV